MAAKTKKKKKIEGVELRATAVGKGLFATQRFDEEVVVGEVKGELIDDVDYGSDYCMHLDENAKIEPKEPFRYLNHSCDPNCELVIWKTRKSGESRYPRLWVQTLHGVKRGEELTIDYGWPADAAIPCLCKSPRCRGWIVDAKELKKVLREAAK